MKTKILNENYFKNNASAKSSMIVEQRLELDYLKIMVSQSRHKIHQLTLAYSVGLVCGDS